MVGGDSDMSSISSSLLVSIPVVRCYTETRIIIFISCGPQVAWH